MSILRFTPGGIALTGYDGTIHIWDLKARARLHRQVGELLGVDRQGRTCLVETPEGTIRAWALASGAAVPIESIAPETFALGQRVRTRITSQAVEIDDCLTGQLVRRIELDDLTDPRTGGPHFDRVSMSEDGQWVAVSISGDSTWGEWARGYCLGPDGRTRFEFVLNHLAQSPLLAMSPTGHHLLAEHQQAYYALYDPASGQRLALLQLADAFSPAAAAFWETGTIPRLALQETSWRVGVYAFEDGLARLGGLETRSEVETACFVDEEHLSLLLAGGEMVVHSLRTWQAVYRLALVD